jgi:hypothetical protein
MAAAFLPFLLMGASALGGALNKPKPTVTTNKSSSSSTGTTMPTYDDAQLDVRNFLLRELMGGVESTPDYAKNYTAQGIAGINKNADATQNQIRQAMLGRGLGRTSAGIAPEIAGENARFGAISQFENSVPLYMEELRRNRLKDFSQFFSSLPVGSTQNQSSNSEGTQTATPGGQSALQGGLSGASQMGAFLYGSGAFGNNGNNSGGVQPNTYSTPLPNTFPIWNPVTGRME